MTPDELLRFLKSQIEIEHEIVESLNSALTEIENPVVKGVLEGISLDSVKHAKMYSAATTLLQQISQALTQQHLDQHRDIIEKHIVMEDKLIKNIQKIVPEIGNEKVKLLLNAVLSDERRHHDLLNAILEVIIKEETITEEDWWDMLWKNAVII